MPTLGPSAIAGACAGLVSSIVTCPLDVVKTKLQAQASSPKAQSVSPGIPQAGAVPSSPLPAAYKSAQAAQATHAASVDSGERVYRGLTGTLRTIYRDDGVRGFYRGLGPTIFGYLPTWAIYFTVYDGCKDLLASRGGTRQRGEEDFVNHILSALTAGAASTVCTSPLWVVKTRFMLQSTKPRSPNEPPPYKHTLDAFIRIMQSEGPRGFYRGLLPSLMGVSHVAVQFPLYEKLKGWARTSSWATQTGAGSGSPDGRDISPKVILLCSSTAKMIASVLTYPHEVVRTRLQMQPRAKEQTGRSSLAAASLQTDAQHATDGRRSYSTAPRVRKPPPPLDGGSRHLPLWHVQRATLFSSSRTAASETCPSLKYSGVVRTVRTIFVEEGFRGFYNGMGVNLIRTVPSSALTILTYEIIMSHLTSQTSDATSA
ncbi:unnamed protein product [Parajaminaea phylloscopi]